MGRGPKIKNNEEFTEDWNAGVLGKEMAKKYGVKEDTLLRHAMRLGLFPRYKGSLALVGGQWVTDDRGIKRWVKGER